MDWLKVIFLMFIWTAVIWFAFLISFKFDFFTISSPGMKACGCCLKGGYPTAMIQSCPMWLAFVYYPGPHYAIPFAVGVEPATWRLIWQWPRR